MSQWLPGASWAAGASWLRAALDHVVGVVAVVAVAIAAYVSYKVVKKVVDTDGTQSVQLRLKSLLLDYANVANYAPAIRSQFSDTPYPRVKSVAEHPHGVAAARRSAATAFAEAYAKTLGRVCHHVSMSAADQRHGHAGSRAFYWLKDFTASARDDEVPENAIVVFTDVDYYVDMPDWLSRNRHPVIIYTKTPTKVADYVEGCAHHFDENNNLVEKVAGGGDFTHELWDYASDALKPLLAARTFLGIPYHSVGYLVERRGAGPHRSVILLTPVCRFRGLWAWLAGGFLGKVLGRLRVSRPLKVITVDVMGKATTQIVHYARLRVIGKNSDTISTGPCGSATCATVPANVDGDIAVVARRDGKLTVATIQSCIPGSKEATGEDANEIKRMAHVLAEYYGQRPATGVAVTYYNEQGVRNYQHVTGTYDEEAAPSMHAFMTALVPEGFAPQRCLNNDTRAVRGRVLELQVDDSQAIPAFELQCMAEFVDLLVPDKNRMHPTDHWTVFERQNRPTQQKILEEADVQGATFEAKIKAFMKREAGNLSDPRVISTIIGKDKYEWSRFMYVASDSLKQQPWYAVGMTPRVIGERVTVVCSEAQRVAITDFSRYDGHIDAWCRMLERMFVFALFAMDYWQELDDLLRSQYNLKATTFFGAKYDQKRSRASGSPETSIFNTLLNAYIAYRAFRMARLSPLEALRRLGLYLGDDGVTPDICRDTYARAALIYGQVLDVEIVEKGRLGVMFLARKYGPGVWFRNPANMCDIRRTLAKLHLTVCLPPLVTPEEKLIEKCRAILLSDANTPVLGRYAHLVMVAFDAECDLVDRYGIRPWNVLVEASEQYNNDVGEWAYDIVREEIPDFDLRAFNDALHAAIDDRGVLLRMPALTVPTRPRPSGVVVDGDAMTEVAPTKPSTHAAAVHAAREEAGAPPVKQASSVPQPAVSREVLLKRFMSNPAYWPRGKRTPAQRAEIRKFFKTLPPAPRLVGIEPNPGPGSAWAIWPIVIVRVASAARHRLTIPLNHVKVTVGYTTAQKQTRPTILLSRRMAKDKTLVRQGKVGATSKEIIVAKRDKKKGGNQTKVRSPGAKNMYLLCILNPFSGPLAGVPDTVTMKSVKFRTVLRKAMSTGTNATWLIFAVAPTLLNGLETPGGDINGVAIHSIISGATALGTDVAASISGVLTAADLAMIAATFAQVRPVAMGAKFTCTQALTSATGVHGMRLMGSCTFPWNIDSAASASGGLAASAYMASTVNGAVAPTPPTPSTASQLVSSLETAVNITEPIVGLWCPEDSSSSSYVPASGSVAMQSVAEFTKQQYYNSVLAETDQYALPYGLGVTGTSTNFSAVTVEQFKQQGNLPMIVYGATGLATGAVGELELSICWEGVPLPYAGEIMGPTLSPSMPDELSQAMNVLELVPSTYLPQAPADINRTALGAAAKTAGHLYDGTPKQDAVSGKSIAKVAGAALGLLSPALGLVPGVGAVLGPGAALLGGLISGI